MSKINLNSIVSGFNLSKINDNFTKISDALNNKVLYRDNPVGENNSVNTDIDMNNRRIYNLPTPVLDSEPTRLQDIKNIILGNSLGATPSLITQSTVIATAGQTVVTVPLYTIGSKSLEVFKNGKRLLPVTEYIETSTTSITLVTPATAGDAIYVRAFQFIVFGSVDSVNVAASDGTGGTLFSTVQGFINKILSSSGGTVIGFLQSGLSAVNRNINKKVLEIKKSVEDYGGIADGITNNDVAIAAAASASNGRFHLPGPGTYVCSSSIWNYPFTAGDNVSVKIGVTVYDVSNAIAGAWRYTVDSPVLMSLRHAVTGNVLQQWQDGAGGTATYFYRGLAFKTDSHWCQVKPASLNGSVDLLWQRSDLNADPNGNRFNETFNESIDRLDFSYATTNSGLPNFDTYMSVTAGTAPKLVFPALTGVFNQGFGTTARGIGTFGVSFIPKTSSVISIKDTVGGTEIGTVDLSNGFVFNNVGWSNPTYGTGVLTYITNGIAISTSGASNLAFFQNGAEAWRIDTSKNFIPGADNSYSIGSASKRTSVIYSGTSAINTSDERAKQDIESIPKSWLDAWSEVEFVRFKYKEAVEQKGDGSRWHVGVIAQRVKDAFEKHGINPFEIGILCWDRWEDQYSEELVADKSTGKLIPVKKLLKQKGEQYGIRYEEALVLECAYLRNVLKGMVK